MDKIIKQNTIINKKHYTHMNAVKIASNVSKSHFYTYNQLHY